MTSLASLNFLSVQRGKVPSTCFGVVLPLIALFFTNGCASNSSQSVELNRPQAPFYGDVAVYDAKQPIPTNFREIALVQARHNGSSGDPNELLMNIKAEAAKLGCTTIVQFKYSASEDAVVTGTCGYLVAN